VHRRISVRLGSIALGVSAAVAAFGPRSAAAAEPQKGGEPTFAAPEEDDGKERPFAPDQRTGHVYVSPIFGMVGAVGQAGPNIQLSSLIGLGYTAGGIVGLGVSRHATVQVFGEYSGFQAPGNCRVGCSGWGYALGLGVTYHLAQGLAVDPWGSFGIAYRRSLFQTMAPTAVVADGKSCAAGSICAEGYGGLDVARIAFGGDFYPVPWMGFGPFVEVDAGTNLGQPYLQPPVSLPPNVGTGPRAYAYFSLGVRVTFDPVRQGSLPRRPVSMGETPKPPARPVTASSPATSGM
jgi:hypothetical protein